MANHNKIKVIVFDLGNVLIPFDYMIIIDKLNSIEAGLGDKFYNLYAENYHIHRQFEKWELSTDSFLKIMTEWLENRVTAEEFCVLYANIFTVNHKVVDLLPKLKENYTLVLLSNTNYIHQKYGWQNYKFLEYFDKLILSHEVGAIKPESKIYKAVEDFTCESPAAHIFIDDIEDYVNGAIEMGWDGIKFENYEQLFKELNNRGLI